MSRTFVLLDSELSPLPTGEHALESLCSERRSLSSPSAFTDEYKLALGAFGVLSLLTVEFSFSQLWRMGVVSGLTGRSLGMKLICSGRNIAEQSAEYTNIFDNVVAFSIIAPISLA